MPTAPETELALLRTCYDTLATLLDREGARFFEKLPGSDWTPAQHAWHVAVANGMMFKGIRLLCEGRHPQARPEGAPNEIGRHVLATGRMPRGRARAPEAVRPPDTLDLDTLREALQRSRQGLEALAPLLPRLPAVTERAPHPFLGWLSATEWLQVARIHTMHHLHIIDELLGA